MLLGINVDQWTNYMFLLLALDINSRAAFYGAAFCNSLSCLFDSSAMTAPWLWHSAVLFLHYVAYLFSYAPSAAFWSKDRSGFPRFATCVFVDIVIFAFFSSFIPFSVPPFIINSFRSRSKTITVINFSYVLSESNSFYFVPFVIDI